MKYAILNQKGGVGKSVTTVNLGYELARLGKKVLLIDLDPQAHTTMIYVHEKVEYTIADFILNESITYEDVIIQAVTNDIEIDNLHIIPSNIRWSRRSEELHVKYHRESILKEKIRLVEEYYDYVLMDCPPQFGTINANVINCCDSVIIPTAYSRVSIDGIADLFETIREVKQTEKYSYKILRNMYNVRTTRTNEYIEDTLKPFDKFKVRIRLSEPVNQAYLDEKPVGIFNKSCNGAKDFVRLAKEVIQNKQ